MAGIKWNATLGKIVRIGAACIGQYIDSSTGEDGACNCTYYYLYGWGNVMTSADLYERPWVATVAYKLTKNVDAYTDLAYSYKWFTKQQNRNATFMVHGQTCPKLRPPIFRDRTPSQGKPKKPKSQSIGMAAFSG